MYLFGLLIIAIVVSTAKCEVDCSQRPPRVNFGNCCELSNVLSEEVKEKCADQSPPDGHHHGPPGRGRYPKHGLRNHCFLPCVVNETGILIDNELQQDNVISYLNELFGDSEKVDFLSNKFVYCNEKRKNFQSKWPERRNGPPPHCGSMENGMLMGCVHVQAFKDCPDPYWSNTDECNEVRDHFNQCWPNKDVADEEEEI